MAKQNLKFVGRDVPRVDGLEKVTGKARFMADITVPGMLHGKILRSPYPHARLLHIDPSRAAALEGVFAVLTREDLAGLDPYYSGRPVIAIDNVRYIGEPVAAVAASDLETAEEALSLIAVDYEELRPVIGLVAALAEGAPLVHENSPGNICGHERVERGEIQRGFAESDAILEHTFTFPMVYHSALEPHAVIAHYTEEAITVWSSAQHPFQVRSDLARIFGVPTAVVRVIIPYVGGGFGSKSYTKFEPLVVALARKARRPVRICLSMTEAMLTVRRHSARVRLKTGFKRDGALVAREAEIYIDTGGYADNGPAVAVRAATRVLGPYRIPHIRSDAYAVYTNSVSAGSFRSIGAPQTVFSCESQMDIIAGRLGMDPAVLRMKNLLKRGEELRPRLRPIDADLGSGLQGLLSASRWKERWRKRAPIGLACGVTNAGATPISVAILRMQADGRVNVFAGSTEMGQGVRTVLSQIVAEELSVPIEQVQVVGADTAFTPYDSSTGSSRSTTLMGRAVQAAAQDLKSQLAKIGARALRVSENKIRFENGYVTSGKSRLSYRDVLAHRFGASAGELVGRGDIGPEITGSLPVIWEIAMGVAEVGVDAETGQVTVRRYVSASDVGKAIHPSQCAAQEEGAAMMGIGHTLFEEMLYEDGRLANPSLADYKIATFADIPSEMYTILIENQDGAGPYGSRGMGEGGIVPVAPAVANAVAKATGIRIYDLPLTAERVWRELKRKAS